MADATMLKHYVNYPVCGFCMNAWDILYGRQRTTISCEKWLSFCHWGGCDPDIWDYLDERTGWPLGTKIDPKTMWPRYFTNHNLAIPIPEYDNRVYHMRETEDDRAPWRKTSDRLRAEYAKVKAGRKPIDLNEVAWDDEEEITDEDVFGPFGDDAVDAMQGVDLDDPDLW